MSEIQLKATNVEDKPVRIGDLPIVKTNILENAGQMDKGVVGGYNGAFPLTAASEGGIYLLPSTGKFYVCETAYNGAQISAPNSNFVELSVWKNHDRLNNLGKSETENIFIGNYDGIDFNKTVIVANIFKSMNIVTIVGNLSINNSSPTISQIIPEGYRPYKSISFQCFSEYPFGGEKPISTHTGTITTNGDIVMNANSFENRGIIFIQYLTSNN